MFLRIPISMQRASTCVRCALWQGPIIKLPLAL